MFDCNCFSLYQRYLFKIMNMYSNCLEILNGMDDSRNVPSDYQSENLSFQKASLVTMRY